jgi:hypothetical protein
MGTIYLLAIVLTAEGAIALQQRAELATEALPNEASPFDEMKSKMDKLQAGMAKATEHSQKVANKQKSIYESELRQQQEQIQKVEASNAGLAGDLASLRTGNARIREKCTAVMNDSQAVAAELRGLQEKIGFAQEFGRRTLKTFDSALHTSPELKVMRAATEEQHMHAEELEHERRLQELYSMSMFQLPAQEGETGPGSKAKDLMKELESSFDTVIDEQRASLASLKAAFEKEFKMGARHLETLLNQEAELKATKTLEEKLNSDLAAALKHLLVTHEYLLQHCDAARKFVAHLSERPIPVQEASFDSLPQAQAPTTLKTPPVQEESVDSLPEEVDVNKPNKPMKGWLGWLKR